jgi:glycosyltransferase involved in cell wall biosynthesis
MTPNRDQLSCEIRSSASSSDSFGPSFHFFTAVPFRQTLRGRIGAMADVITARGYRLVFFEYPPITWKELLMPTMNVTHRRFEYICPRVDWQRNPSLVTAPAVLPGARRSRVVRQLNRWQLKPWLRRQIRHCRVLPERPQVAIVTNPWWRQFLRQEDFDILCYDLIDDPVVFSGPAQYSDFLKWETQLLDDCHIISYSASALKDTAARNPRARHLSLPNAVNAELFRSRAREQPEPEDLNPIPHPRVGFLGAVFHWLDLELIAQAARSLPDFSFVFVGPLEKEGLIDQLLQLPNFHFLGPKPFERVPAYISGFDVCLCPFQTDRVGQAVDPLKIYEYFALGKPVVATRIRELAKLQPMTYIVDDTDGFVRDIRQAADERNPELVARRIAFALDNSWDRRVDRLLNVIQECWSRQ